MLKLFIDFRRFLQEPHSGLFSPSMISLLEKDRRQSSTAKRWLLAQKVKKEAKESQ